MSTNNPEKDPAETNVPATAEADADVATQFATRLHRTRKERNFTLRDVALESGVSIAYLSDLERAKLKNPTLDTLRRIANALRVSVDSLLGDESSERRDPGPLPQGLDAFMCGAAFDHAITELAHGWKRDEQELRHEWARLLAGVHVAGRYPRSDADWMFVFESIRRAVDT